MPQSIAYFIWAVTPTFVTQAVATVIANVIVATALAYASTKYQQSQLKQNLKQGPREVIVRDTTQPQVVVYGEAFVGGVICYMNTVHPGVNQGHELHMAILVAGHEIEDVTDIYLDDTLLRGGTELDWTTTNAVVSGIYDPDSRTDCEAVKVWKHLGTASQTVDTELNANYTADWTSDYRLRGLAYLVFRFKLTEKSGSLWTGGPPQSIRIKVKGKKCYDPRTGTTAWTSNPVLCAADYMTSFMGVASTRMDWDWIGTQASVCDTVVNVPGPSTEARYTCNGSLSLGETHKKNIEAILSSCMGRLSKVGGKWRITAGAYEFPSVSLSDADIVGPIVMSTSLQRSERYNTVRGVFGADPNNKYREMEFRQVTSSTYVARDNGETIVRSLSLPMTNSEYMAQRIAFKTLRQGDQQTTVTLPVRWTGLRVAVGSCVNLTISRFGWSGKVFRCIGWKMGGGEAPFELVLREDAPSAWNDPDVGDYTTVSASGAVTLPDEDVAVDNPVIPLINHIPTAFGDFENVSIDQFDFTGSSSGYSASIATDRYWLGTKSLKITPATGTNKIALVQFAKYGTSFYNLKLPPDRRLMVVFAIQCDNTDAQGTLDFFIFYNGPGGTGNIYTSALDLSTVTTVDAWSRLALEIDATGVEATQAVLSLRWAETGTTTVSPTFWIDGVELLDVTDFPSITEDNFPTHWIPPTGSTSGAVGLEGGARILAGDDSPEGVVTASPGSTYHDNANGNVYLKASGTSTTGWVQLASTSGAAQTKVADSDSANSSSTTLADDAELAGFDVLAATEYLLEAELRFTTANDASDLKYSWQFSQTPQAAAGFLVDEGGTGVTDGTVSSVTLTSTSTRNSSGGSDYVLRVSARVLGHATLAGTMDFQWARGNASGTTTRKAGSWMRLTPTN